MSHPPFYRALSFWSSFAGGLLGASFYHATHSPPPVNLLDASVPIFGLGLVFGFAWKFSALPTYIGAND